MYYIRVSKCRTGYLDWGTYETFFGMCLTRVAETFVIFSLQVLWRNSIFWWWRGSRCWTDWTISFAYFCSNSKKIAKKSNSKIILKKFRKNSETIPREFRENSERIPKEFQKNSKRILKVFRMTYEAIWFFPNSWRRIKTF